MKLTLIDNSTYTIHEMENLMLEYKEIRKLLDKISPLNTRSNINKVRFLLEEYNKVKK